MPPRRIGTKELKLRPNTDTHDYEVKVRQAQRFLSKGDRVKVTLQFKGREMDHNEIGKEMFSVSVGCSGVQLLGAASYLPGPAAACRAVILQSWGVAHVSP
jgi:hypothetical protein